MGRRLNTAEDQTPLLRIPRGRRTTVFGKDFQILGTIGEEKSIDFGPTCNLATPSNRVEIILLAKDFFQQQTQPVNLAIVAVQPETTILRQQIAQQEESFINKLEIAVPTPRIPILHGFSQ